MFAVTSVDLFVIVFYFVLVIGIGFAMRKRAASGVDSYFLAGRSLAWWWLGTSIVATTFSADTPLAVAGITAKQGISGNWFWWSWILTYMAVTVFFSKRWRRTGALTDVEFTELRYEGRPAIALRVTKAFYLSVIMNSIILGWIFRSLSKIFAPYIRWSELIGADAFVAFAAYWPSVLNLGSTDSTITLLVSLGVILIYSSMGGIRSGVINDLIQFCMAMGGSILFAVLAVKKMGGMNEVVSKVSVIDPSLLDFFPDFDKVPWTIFAVYFVVQWWAQYFSDGTGYIAQRMNTAKTEKDAQLGSLWFNVANYALRSWPWIIIGLVGLAMFPPGSDQCGSEAGSMICADREMAYPVLIHTVLGSHIGLVGFMLAGLLAAFMSTVDTHINWGASYLVNDIYLRFFRKDAGRIEQIVVSRFCVILIAVVGLVVATYTTSIESAWKFLLSMAAGLGLPQMLRWLWWRANAYTEISGMIASLVLSLILYPLFADMADEHLLFFTAVGSATISILVTFLTQPVSAGHLRQFVAKVNPLGVWPKHLFEDELVMPAKATGKGRAGIVSQFRFQFDVRNFGFHILIWIVSCVAVLSMMFLIGYLLFGNWPAATITLLVMLTTGFISVLGFRRLNRFSNTD